MFRSRGFRGVTHHRTHRQRGGGNLGLFLLGIQILQFGVDNIPLITLITLCLNCAIFLHFPPNLILPLHDVCISFTNVWHLKEWRRLFLAPWYHGSDIHLYYNMSSLIWKGSKLENRFGPIRFAVTLVTFCIVSTVLTVALSFAASEIMDDGFYLSQCAVGFSGVLFAFKVLLSYYDSTQGSYTRVMFLTVPVRMAFWVELVLIQILVPNASFVGHLAGILTGLLFVKGPLKAFVKECTAIIQNILGGGAAANWGRNSRQSRDSGYSTYGSGRLGGSRSPPQWNSFSGNMSERDQMEWAMRDNSSMNRRAASSRAPTNEYNQANGHRNPESPDYYPSAEHSYSGHFYQEPSAPPEETSNSFNSENDVHSHTCIRTPGQLNSRVVTRILGSSDNRE